MNILLLTKIYNEIMIFVHSVLTGVYSPLQTILQFLTLNAPMHVSFLELP